MTSPLYSVGQSVAVCNAILTVVIPKTIVTDVVWRPPGSLMCASWGKEWESKGHWSYEVKDSPPHPEFGGPHRFAEWCLRPINPDTEYLTDSAPQKLEQPA